MQTVVPTKQLIGHNVNIYYQVAFALPIIFTVLCVLLFGINVPFNDQWEFSTPLARMMKQPDTIWPELWNLHNEHRLVFPKFIMLVLALLTGWDIRAELVVNVLLAGAILYLLVRKAQTTLTYAPQYHLRPGPPIVFVILSMLTFSMAQSENWMWGWQLQIFLNVLSVIAGFGYLTLSENLSVKHWLIAILCGLVATFSFANGLLYWIIGLIGLLARPSHSRVDKWLIFGWISVSIGVWIAYLTNYRSVGEHPSTQYVLMHPDQAIQYSLAYLGNSISQFRQMIPIGVGVGLIGVLLVFWLGFRLAKQGMLLNPALLFWHLLLLYALTSDGITAIGRTGFGIQQAFSSRYATISNLFWFWILVVLCWQYQRSTKRTLKISYGIGGLFFVLFIASTAKNTYKFKQRHDELAVVASALKANKYNLTLLLAAHPKPQSVINHNVGLRKNNLSFYRSR